MCTMREQATEDLQQIQRIIEALGSNVPEYYHNREQRLQADLAWYETDEPRPCWTVTELFECPVIYTEKDEWAEWLEDMPDEVQKVTITEGVISGTAAGDLEYFEP